MAFPVIPDKYLGEFEKQEVKNKVTETVSSVAKKTSQGVMGFGDLLLILVVAFWYFFFTGLAIILKRDIPKQWLRLGTSLGMARVSSRIKKASQNALQKDVASENTPKRVFKVVDIDTKRPIKRISVNKESSMISPVTSPS